MHITKNEKMQGLLVKVKKSLAFPNYSFTKVWSMLILFVFLQKPALIKLVLQSFNNQIFTTLKFFYFILIFSLNPL